MKIQPDHRRKILHFVDSAGIYGAESVILQLCQEMLRGEEFEPIVGCIVQNKNEKVDLYDRAMDLGIAAARIVINNKRFLIDVPRAAVQLRKERVALIHSHGYKPSVLAYFIAKATGMRVLATCHLWFPGSNPPLRYRFMTGLELLLYRFYPRIVCVSDPIRKHLVDSGVKAGRIVRIDNGIDLEEYNRQDDQKIRCLRKELGLREDSVMVLNVGRLTEQKAQKNIVLATKLLKERGRSVYVLIVGEGELRQDLQFLIERNGLECDVRLLGFRNDVKDLLQLADIFLLPSLDEGLPISLLEAIASKKPVITTAVGEIPKLIEHDKDGYLVPINDVIGIADAVEFLLNNQEKGFSYATNALVKLKDRYSSKRMSEAYDQVYREVVKKQGRY